MIINHSKLDYNVNNLNTFSRWLWPKNQTPAHYLDPNQNTKCNSSLVYIVYKIPYCRALGLAVFRPSARTSKGLLHITNPNPNEKLQPSMAMPRDVMQSKQFCL